MVHVMKPKDCTKIYWDEDYLREQLEKGKNYLDIAHENEIGIGTAQRALRYYGLTKSSAPWSAHEISSLKKLYGNERKFREYFPNRSMGALYHKTCRLGLRTHIKPRQHRVDEDFFKNWNHNMAYVLGWMFSDGSVCSDERTFEIKISFRDLEILKKIRKILSSESPLRIVEQKLPSKKEYRKYARLRINSYKMCKDLVRLGCVPKKARKFSIPPMPRCFLKHFVRGYFDGDGSISFNKPNTIRIRIVSCNEPFIKSLAEVFERELHIPANSKRAKDNLWQCDYYGDSARKICGWMYEDCGNLFLKRKRDRYISHLKKKGYYA